ncbi:MAG: small-conductance mechanosensitive channel [Chlamydiales bacterium]|jgi:small-conductance mechanosensitive channel
MMFLEFLPYWLFESYFVTNAIHTALFLCMIIFMRYVAVKSIRDSKKLWSPEQRLRWIGTTRTTYLWIMLIGLFYIWSEEVHTLALSLFAIALAIVLAIKEMLLCFNGSFLRVRGHSYDLGDRIEINGLRGDVIDINLFATTVMEVGPSSGIHHQTGRSITFPNSMLLNSFVVNESFLEDFYLHNIEIPIKVSDDWRKARKLLLNIAIEESENYIDRARRRIQQLERRRSLELPSMEPRVMLTVKDPENLLMTLYMPSPSHFKARVEQAVMDRFIEAFYVLDSLKEGNKEESPVVTPLMMN